VKTSSQNIHKPFARRSAMSSTEKVRIGWGEDFWVEEGLVEVVEEVGEGVEDVEGILGLVNKP
ncbi:hypothetical protein A2U01_0046447, partial [Trifolium medium]|nr:hypothetical protein [Trifolium medium]